MEPTQQQPHSDRDSMENGLPGVEGAQVSIDRGSEYLITVQVEPQFVGKIDADQLHMLTLFVLRSDHAQGPLEVGVMLTTDDEVHSLNRQYLGHDYKTDVISFGMSDEGAEEFVTPDERPQYLGDVVISYDRAAEQGPEYGHTPEQEVATLLVHGLLHLLGYDDLQDEARAQMHARQDRLVAQFLDGAR